MYDQAATLINNANSIVIIQGENPDGDSLGSSLALEDILENRGKKITMFCAIDMPKYLRYFSGSDRTINDFPFKADLAIIVDTATETLIEKALAINGIRSFLESHPVVVLDHHGEEGDQSNPNNLQFSHEYVLDKAAASTGELIYRLAVASNWEISPIAAEALFSSIASDTLGLTTEAAGATTYQVVADLVKLGANPHKIETARREFMKKPADILAYKGVLIDRIEYSLDGDLATVHIPWEDIQKYSDRYNPSVLVLDEMRLVENVKVACAIKTYPDGKLTGKLRTNLPVANQIAGYFGGGGHKFAAGFKIYEDYDTTVRELISATDKALKDFNATANL
ncbi:MAG: DHH family phosphoesterase [Candidatus Saccharimonas sp.]